MKKKIRIKIKKKPKGKPQNTKVQVNSEIGLAERKQQLKRKRKKQRLKRRFIIFLIFAVIISAVAVLLKAPFFNISEVICVGQERLTEKEILNTARVAKGQNIFLTNIGKVKERVSSIPFVSESNARRIFPNKVKIWVRESVPAFAIERDGKFVICDKSTKVLEVTDKNKDNLCLLMLSNTSAAKPGELYADEGQPQNKKLLEIIGILEKLDMINSLNYIDFSDISDIIILYDSRLKIKIGNTNDMDYKLKFINKVIKENISEYEKATVDYTGDKLYVGQYEDKSHKTNAEEKPEAEAKNTEANTEAKVEEKPENETKNTEAKAEEKPEPEVKNTENKNKGE